MYMVKRGILYLIFLLTWICFTWWFLTYTSLYGKDGQDSILSLPYLLISPLGSVHQISSCLFTILSQLPSVPQPLDILPRGFSFRDHPLSFLTKWKIHMYGVTERRSLGLAFVISSLVYLDLFRLFIQQILIIIPIYVSLSWRKGIPARESHFIFVEVCGPWRVEEKESFWSYSWRRNREDKGRWRWMGSGWNIGKGPAATMSFSGLIPIRDRIGNGAIPPY